MTDITQPAPQLAMRRDDLAGLPALSLPAGYALRSCRQGDGEHWARIINESFGSEHTVDNFLAIMVHPPCYRPDRLFFIVDPEGIPCATAGAYQFPAWGEQTGYLHYVGVRPAYQGRRLGHAVSLAVLRKFSEDGMTNAVLQTDDFRFPAIKTYLGLGFHPLIVHENQPERWRAVLAALQIEAGQGWLDAVDVTTS